ncbi:DUF7601 domain-containing protein [Parvimonas parva]|uniref:DUF7601 domain-containing protein n=1 Tax=Parvimonas parva TaxID=2769485 RepID=A0ABS1C9F4_9FIRM|nr:FctA domain-containing protein [Parvimonas parva]MBK1468514.1 hypothetical protein [Parvimonas parva]
MKNKSIKNKVFASALALTLTIGAFQLPSYVANADETPAPQLKLKKVLNLPKDGVSTPDVTFNFQFEEHSFNKDTTKKDKLPKIQGKPAVFNKTMVKDMDKATEGKQIVKLTDDVLKDIQFKEAGQYTYSVTETKGNTTDITYSKATYLVSLLVGANDKGNFVVKSIEIKKEKDDKGVDVTNPQKTPYKPGTGDNGEGNEFVFNNHYDPKAGNKNPDGKEIKEDDKKGFVLRKEVAGEKANFSENFKFKITAKKPEGSHSDAKTFKYKVVTNGVAGQEEIGTYGTAFDVVLKHADKVVFSDVLLGTTVTAEETVDGGYTKDIKDGSKINGQKVTVENLTQGLAIGDDADGNFVNFVNTQQTATGFLMNNLPFIALVLVAGAGILFFVKNKKEDENTQA